MSAKPRPHIGQRWRFEREEGAIVRILPGGSGNIGIAEFDGNIPPAHVVTMMRFPAWQFVAHPPERWPADIDCGDGVPVYA